MSWLAVLALALLLALAGRALPGVAEAPALQRWTFGLLAGCVLFHLLLTAYDAVGLPWGRTALLLPLLGLTVLGVRRRGGRPGLPSDLGWGDGAALFSLAVFSLFAPTLWITTPDFIYHWGIKGHRFFLERGVDYGWLAREWNWVLHPDYPNLLPELYAGGALLAGRFEAPPQMLWSMLLFALLLASGREALRGAGVPRGPLQAALAVLAFALAAFGMGHRMAGAADWMPALALAAALPALLRPPDREGDLQVGIAAAFAAASKIEGMPLAAFLAAAQLLRRAAGERRLDGRALLRLGLLPAAVVLPWTARTFGHGLYQDFNTGRFDPGRTAVVLRGLADAAAAEGWHGLPLLLLASPLLLLPRRTRAAAAVVCLQLLFYLWIYFSAEVDTAYQIISSFPRLALHLFPALLLAGVAALGQGRRVEPACLPDRP